MVVMCRHPQIMWSYMDNRSLHHPEPLLCLPALLLLIYSELAVVVAVMHTELTLMSLMESLAAVVVGTQQPYVI